MKLLYTGLPGTGKTTSLINHYLEFKNDFFQTPGYFIVPTNEQAERITSLILQQRECIFVKNILTFDQFIEKISGKTAIRTVTQQYILMQILKSLPLQYFRAVKEHLSLYEYLAGLINEIKIYSAADLSQPGLKQRELVQILNAYNNYLTENKLLDKADLYRLCLQKLTNQHFDFIILDGFTTFNDRQKELITALSKITNNFLCSHLNLPNYLETLDYYIKLGLQENNLTENKRTTKTDLEHLSRNYLNKNLGKADCPTNIEILIGQNRIIEIEQIARGIIKQKEKTNYAWSDFCLIFRQIGNYQPLLQEIFNFYEIPLTIHEGLYLHKNNFINWLLQLIKLPLNNYPKEELFAVLKAGFHPCSKTEIDQLEILALTKVVFENKEKWLTLAKEISLVLEQNLFNLFARLEEFSNVQTYTEIKDLIEKLINDLDLIKNLKNLTGTKELIGPIKDISHAYNSLLDILAELAELQKEPAALTELIKQLEYFLTQKIITIKERQGNQVQVYDSLVARQKEYKVVFLVNLTSKSVPLYIKEDLFLKDYERHSLKKSLLKQQEEEYLFYLSLTRAREKLYLTYALNELTGSKIEPSPYLKNASALFPEKSIKQTIVKQSAAIPTLNECLTLKDLQQAMAYHFYKKYTNAELHDLEQKTKDLTLIADLIRKNKDFGEYAEYRAETKKILAELKEFGAKSLETLSQCRFAFFAEYILKIADPQELTLAIPTGEIIHEALKEYYSAVPAENLDSIFSRNKSIFEEKLFFLQKKQLAIELKRIQEKLKLFLDKEKIELTQRPYQPTEFELAVNKEFNGVNIKAKIDRIDKSENKALVIDYKTGQLPEIGLAKIESGLIPQAWLYCLLLISVKDLEIAGCEYVQIPKNVRKGIYLEMEKSALGKAKSRNILSAEKMQELLKLTRKFLINYLSEIKVGNFYSKQDKCLEYCQFGNICRMKQK